MTRTTLRSSSFISWLANDSTYAFVQIEGNIRNNYSFLHNLKFIPPKLDQLVDGESIQDT